MSAGRAGASCGAPELPGFSGRGGRGLQIGGPARAIENCDAALAAAEFPNQINEIVRAGRDIAGPVAPAP